MRHVWAAIGVASALFVWAGGVHAGEAQKCSQKMTISDERFSIRADNGTMEDILCALQMRSEMCAMEQISFDQSAKVKDYATGEEIKMTEAFFVITDAVKTPQMSGLIAFKTREAALEFAKSDPDAKVLDFPGLVHQGLVK